MRGEGRRSLPSGDDNASPSSARKERGEGNGGRRVVVAETVAIVNGDEYEVGDRQEENLLLGEEKKYAENY